jgi:hypothetical protein
VEFFAKLAPKLGLAQSDIEFWRDVGNAESPQFILKQKDLYLREAAVLIIGNEPAVS